MGKVKPRKSRIPLDRKEVKEIIEGKEINVNVVPDPKLAQPMPVKVVIPENQPVVAKNYPGLNPSIDELFFEVDQVNSLESRLKRKDTLIQEQQKKIRAHKQRITRLEEEARNRNRTIASYQTELIQFSKELEERQNQQKALEASLEKNRLQLEEARLEKQAQEKEKVQLAKEITALQQKLGAAEKEISGLRTELKQKAQDNASLSREVREAKKSYGELQESFDVLLAQNTSLDRQVQDLKKIRQEMESRYTKTLDNLKAEVRIRQGECSKLLREMQDLKREREELERLVDGIELKAEMLSSNNASLQRKLDKFLRQKAIQDEQIKSWLVRSAMAIVNFFSRWTTPKENPVPAEREQSISN
jgi:chromosome segregation ATPase